MMQVEQRILEAARPPRALSLFPTSPSAPGGRRRARRFGASPLAFCRMMWDALCCPLLPGHAAGRVSRQLTMRQIFHTGVEALPLVTALAFVIGSSAVLQARVFDGVVGPAFMREILSHLMIREAAPLVTAIVVASRSGTTMAAEIGNMQTGSELLALRAMGIDTQRFIVWPRLVGAVVAVTVLSVYFGVVAILAIGAIGGMVPDAVVDPLSLGPRGLGWPDLFLFGLKASGLGAIVGAVCCHHGLLAGRADNDVPVRASRAVVHSLAACVLYSTFASWTFYTLFEVWR